MKNLLKTWLLASALTLGMAVLTPLQAGATAVDTTNNVTIQIEQKITGTIKYFDGSKDTLKGTDGKTTTSVYTISQINKLSS